VSGEVTASGLIRRFSLDGVTGDVFLDIDGTPDEVTTNTVSGNLTVRLGADVATSYRLNTVSGTLQLDDQTIKGTLGKGYELNTGSLDGSWLELRGNSVSGNISVVRRTNGSSAPAAEGSTDASGQASS
jgi:hypothetical protein